MAKVEHRPIRVLVYGDPGCGKSSFAATFPKPMLVLSFDPAGKEQPYLDRGASFSDLIDLEEASGVKGVEGYQVFFKSGKLMTQVELYADENPEDGVGALRFRTRMTNLHHYYEQFRTIVLDNVSSAERTLRFREKFKVNAGTKEPRQWSAASTDGVEQLIGARLANMRRHNVVTIAHVDEQKDEFNGHMIRTIKAPGRMRKGLADAYQEVYHAYVKTEDQESLYLLQTQASNMWMAASRIRPVPPDPCPQNYEDLFSNEKAVAA